MVDLSPAITTGLQQPCHARFGDLISYQNDRKYSTAGSRKAGSRSVTRRRADAEAQAARKTGDHDRAGRHEELAASYRALGECYRQREAVFAQAMADRQEWEHATAGSRHLAVAADTELRRRHPDHVIEPLHSAEPAPSSDNRRDDLTVAPGKNIGDAAAWISALATQRQSFREKLEERQGLQIPSEDPDWADLGEAFPAWRALGRDAILQPPKPQITPSTRILQPAAQHDMELEATD
jgi:hypothetical protein